MTVLPGPGPVTSYRETRESRTASTKRRPEAGSRQPRRFR